MNLQITENKMDNKLEKTSKQYNFSAIRELTEIEPFSLENDKLLLEIETKFHILGILIIICGIVLLFWHPQSLGIILSIIISVFLIVLGFLFVREIHSYTVLYLKNNTLYREYRVRSYIFFKLKLVDLSNISQIGITHKIGLPLNFWNIQNKMSFKLALTLLKGNNYYLETKPYNSSYKGIVKTAILYLTKEGKTGCINNFSCSEESDTIYSIFANSLSLYANIPVLEADPLESLTVVKTISKYKFTAEPLKPLSFRDELIRYIIPIAIMLFTIVLFVLLFYSDII